METTIPATHPARLPVDDFLADVVEAMRAGRDVVLVAEPGAGKTTRLPPALLKSGVFQGKNDQIVMLQPRRVAARAAAARIAEEQGWQLGGPVGYQVRFERIASKETKLHVVTEGILARRLVGDPELGGVGCVVLDEFHERSIQGDLSLAMLREAKVALREDLRLVVMSATLDADAAAAFLREAAQVEVFHVPGRLFPVEVEYAGDSPKPVEERVLRALDDHLRLATSRRDVGPGAVDVDGPETGPTSRRDVASRSGDVLIFLPGVREIERTMRAIDRIAARNGYDVLPLHGSLSKDEQDAAVRYDPRDPPRVICATNIAETSLTLPGVRLVIDTGLVREAGYDAARGVPTLETTKISKASAEQRAGRAGRVAAGRCVRLWSRMTQNQLAAFDVPEVRRVDLCEAVLAVRAWGGDPMTFGWYEPPEPRLLASAEALLAGIGAVADGRLTALGKRLQTLPLHPRPARLLTAAPPHLAREATLAAALLGEGAEVPGRRCGTVADLIDAHERRRLDPAVGRAVARAVEQLGRFGGRGKQADVDSLEELLLLAYPDRVCRRRGADTATLVDAGGGVRLPEASAVRGDYFLALDLRRGTQAKAQQADARLVAEIDVEWLDKHFPRAVVVEQAAEWDEEKQAVTAVRRKRYRDLTLEEQRGGAIKHWATAETLLRDRLAGDAAGAFVDGDEVLGPLYRRVDFAETLAANDQRFFNKLPSRRELIWDACVGASDARGVREAARGVVSGLLHGEGGGWLDRMAPESIEVPTGSRIRLDWEAARAERQHAAVGPVMAVRLQELFGLADTPRVGNGTVPVVLHLLGPNYRPVQVTSDLASFWANVYPQVRKDLRARYPKHSWPDDPLEAEAVRGPRRRRAGA